jgi:hypothetical protein
MWRYVRLKKATVTTQHVVSRQSIVHLTASAYERNDAESLNYVKAGIVLSQKRHPERVQRVK